MNLLISTAFNDELILWTTENRNYKMDTRIILSESKLVYIKVMGNSKNIFLLDKANTRIIIFDLKSKKLTRAIKGFFGHYKFDCLDVTLNQQLFVGIDHQNTNQVRFYLKNKSEASTRNYHSHHVNSIKILNAEKKVISCSNDRAICVISLWSYHLIKKFSNFQPNAINQIKFFGNSVFGSLSKKGYLKIFELKGKRVKVIQDKWVSKTHYIHLSFKAGILVLAGAQDKVSIAHLESQSPSKPQPKIPKGTHFSYVPKQPAEGPKSVQGRRQPKIPTRTLLSYVPKQPAEGPKSMQGRPQLSEQSQGSIADLEKKVAVKRETIELLEQKRQNLVTKGEVLELEMSTLVKNKSMSSDKIKMESSFRQKGIEEQNERLRQKIQKQKLQIEELRLGIRELEGPQPGEADVEEYKKVRSKCKKKSKILGELQEKFQSLVLKCNKRKKKNKRLMAELNKLNKITISKLKK